MALNALLFVAALCVLISHARRRRSRRLARSTRTRWDTKTSVLALTLAALALRLTWLVNPGFYAGEIFVPHFAWGGSSGGDGGDSAGTGAGDAVLAVSGVRFLLWKLPHFLRLAAYTMLVFCWREQARLMGRALDSGGASGTAATRKSREIGLLRSMKRFLGAVLLADAALVALVELNVERAWTDRALNMLSATLSVVLVGHGALYAEALHKALVGGGSGGGGGVGGAQQQQQQQQRTGAARGTSGAVTAFVRRVQLVVRVSGGAIFAQGAAYLVRHTTLPYSWGSSAASGAPMGAPDHWGFFWFLTALTLSELLFACGLVLAAMRPSSHRRHGAPTAGGSTTPAATSAQTPGVGGNFRTRVRGACSCLLWPRNSRDGSSSRGGSSSGGGGSGDGGMLCMTVTRDSELVPRPSSLRVSSDEVARQPRLSSGRANEIEDVGERSSERSSEAVLVGFPGGGSSNAQGEELRVTAVALPDSMQDSARVSV